jgi:hypothetical protein
MAEMIRVKVFDFINKDQNYGKQFSRDDVEDYLNDSKVKLQLKNGKFNSLLTHRSRLTSKDIVGNELYSQIAPEDAPLVNRDIAGIVKSIFIKNNDTLADILILDNDCGRFVSSLIAAGVKLSVSISFLDSSDRNSNYYEIYHIQGIDLTWSPAFLGSDVVGVLNEK